MARKKNPESFSSPRSNEEALARFLLYFSAVVDGSGMLKESLSNDGLHPNPQGYALMIPVVEAPIQKTLK